MILLIILGAVVKYIVPQQEVQYYRNFLFVGLPAFGIGVAIRKNYDSLSVSETSTRVISVISILFVMVVHYLVHGTSILNIIIRNISVFLMSASLFVFALTFKSCQQSWLTRLGKEYSLYIYIIHMIIVTSLEMLVKKVDNGTFVQLYSYCHPFVVLMLSILLTGMFKKFKWIE